MKVFNEKFTRFILKFMAIMVDHELVSNSSFYQNVQIKIKLFAGCCWLFDSWLNELNGI